MLILPMDLPGEEMTDILEQTVKELLAELDEQSDQIFSDGVFPGTKVLTAPERLGSYLSNTEVEDYKKLFDDNYLLRLGAGLDTPPVSPYWLNQLSIPDSFERNRRDFQRLVTQDMGRRERYTNPHTAPLPAQPRAGAATV